MNKSMLTPADYIDALPLTPERKAALSSSLPAPEAGGDVYSQLHQQLGQDGPAEARPDDAPLTSVKARIEMSWPDSVDGGKQFGQDYLDRTTLKAMPPVKRSLMFPEAWRTNPLARAWDSLRGRKSTPRYATAEEQRQEDKWRHVGSIRRYILLILTLFQTVIATWYMKTILPYQGWALIDPMDMLNQNWQQSLLQLLPYVLQTGILFLFAILFCWVSAGFWTALMGFLQLMIGRDKYSISYTLNGDEPIDPTHRTALIMPICNEDVERVFAGLRATWESVVRSGESEHFDV
ncbi:MAG: glucan biosynthesis glucosyltransferase H, partial [Mixta calida]|nr:glucan biosynthesis glucosyltransferase H [Mixta calida]